jgi:hypothetical protein
MTTAEALQQLATTVAIMADGLDDADALELREALDLVKAEVRAMGQLRRNMPRGRAIVHHQTGEWSLRLGGARGEVLTAGPLDKLLQFVDL